MKFKSIRWRNLFSYGKRWTKVELDSNLAINIIGANGNGKSVLVEALYFALTGKPLRKCNKNQIVNIINKKDCLVELTVEAGNHRFLIIRGAKPNVFKIYKDGSKDPIDESAMMVDTQTYLETVLGFTKKNLKHTLIMSTTDYTPFLRLNAADKRLFIEDILSIEIFSVMNKLVKSKLSILKDEIRDNATDIDKLQYKLNMILEYNRQQQENDDDEIAELKKNIKDEKETLHDDILAITDRGHAEVRAEKAACDADITQVDANSKASIQAETQKLQADMAELKSQAKACKETLAELKSKGQILAGQIDDQKATIEEHKDERSVHDNARQIHTLKFEADTAKHKTGERKGANAELTVQLELGNKQKDLKYYTETDECSECKQPVAGEFKQGQLDDINAEIKGLQLKATKIKSELNKVANFKKRIDKFKADSITPLDEKCSELDDQITILNQSIIADEGLVQVINAKDVACRKQMETFKASRDKIKTDHAARVAVLEDTDTIIKDMKSKSKRRRDKIDDEAENSIGYAKQKAEHRINGYECKIEGLESKERGNIKDELIPGRDVEEAEAKKKALEFKKLVHDVTIRILSDKGIKTYITKRYIPKLNTLVNQYLEILSASYKVSFNDELVEQIALKGYDKLSYENFSEGERQRCDIALLFAFLDIGKMKNSVTSNLLLMDEVVDRSLDDDGIAGIINIIESMKGKGYTIINISHKHQLADKFDVTLRATKDNFSKLERI